MKLNKDLFIISAIFFTGLMALWFFVGKYGITIFDILVKPHFVMI